MATKKKAERNFVSNVDELSDVITSIGEKLDNAPVSLDRGSYVEGSVSFGSLIMDLVTGGGLPPAKVSNVYGPEGSGKSTACGHLISNAIRDQIPVLFFDHEQASDAKYFRSLGVKMRNPDGSKNPYFHYFQPDTAEQTYKVMAQVLRHLPQYTPLSEGGRPKPQALFLIDSVASMVPELVEESEEEDKKIRMAAAASTHSLYLPMVNSKLGRKNVSIFATNQTRLNPGQMFGNPEYEPGGQAWRFYPALKYRLSAVGQPFVERNRSMRFVNISTKKNKQFPPFITVEKQLAVAFGRGFERGRDSWGYLDLTGQIEKSGTKYKVKMEGLPKDYVWNGVTMSRDALMPILCSNEFRHAARFQLEREIAYKLFFSRNDWELDYKFDEEAPEDSLDDLDSLAAALVNEQPSGVESISPPKVRRSKKSTDQVVNEFMESSESMGEKTLV